VVEALGKDVYVIYDRTEQLEIRCAVAQPDFANKMKHSMQHRSERPVLGMNDANGVHGAPSAVAG
jgi:hypothetical protein